MSTTGYAYAGNPEFDIQVTNQKFIFIFGLKNSRVKIQDSYRFTLKVIQIDGREQEAESRGKELKTNHLYQVFCEMVSESNRYAKSLVISH
ncbi:hypothetical protein NSTC731_02578 [Nostoc sp. DSM 114167]|jgi:hypothetical protein